MKTLLTAATLIPLGACSAPVLTEVHTGGSESPTEATEVVIPSYPTPEPTKPSSGPVIGNPGNDKNVGRAGETKGKGKNK